MPLVQEETGGKGISAQVHVIFDPILHHYHVTELTACIASFWILVGVSEVSARCLL